MTALEYVDSNTYRSPNELGTPKFLIRCTLFGRLGCLWGGAAVFADRPTAPR
jgi:hypothetical protein